MRNQNNQLRGYKTENHFFLQNRTNISSIHKCVYIFFSFKAGLMILSVFSTLQNNNINIYYYEVFVLLCFRLSSSDGRVYLYYLRHFYLFNFVS